jgi:hypothetical protein
MPRYRYRGPEGIGSGTFTNPFLGEVTVGEEYDIDDPSGLFAGHPEWERVTKKREDKSKGAGDTGDDSGDDAGKEA